VRGEGRHRLHAEDGLKALARIGMLMSFRLSALSIMAAFAVDCPNTHKAVVEYHDKTVKVSGVDKPS
jgi:hypothetical protein